MKRLKRFRSGCSLQDLGHLAQTLRVALTQDQRSTLVEELRATLELKANRGAIARAQRLLRHFLDDHRLSNVAAMYHRFVVALHMKRPKTHKGV